MLEGLLIAWILSWFGFDDLFIKGFGEIFNREISTAGYYLCFFLFGASWNLIKLLVGGK